MEIITIKNVQDNRFLPILLFLVIIAAAYGYSLGNNFVWDDYLNIVDNHFIKSFKNFPSLFSREYLTSPGDLPFLTEKDVGAGELSYRPVVTLTYFIDFFIWKLNPFGFHLTNILLHLLNTILVYRLAMKINANRFFALAAALIFAAHPVQAEAVLIPAFREDLLACLFMLGSLVFYAHRNNKYKNIMLIGCYVSYGFALFSKEMAVTLPALILLYHYCFEIDGKFNNLWKNPSGTFWGLGITTAFYMWVWGVVFPRFTVHSATADNVYTNIFTMVTIFGTYIQWFILPLDIHPTMPDSSLLVHTPWNTSTIISLTILAVCIWLVWRERKRNIIISFSIIWFFIAMLPVSNFIPIENLIASRYLYLPSVGFCLIAAFVMERIWSGRSALSSHISRGILMTAGVGLLILYITLVFTKGLLWTNEISFRKNFLVYYPDNLRAYRSLAGAYVRFQQYDDAAICIKNARALNPQAAETYLDLADIYSKQGRPDLAAQEMSHVRLVPRNLNTPQ
jgi:hypothetical protein